MTSQNSINDILDILDSTYSESENPEVESTNEVVHQEPTEETFQVAETIEDKTEIVGEATVQVEPDKELEQSAQTTSTENNTISNIKTEKPPTVKEVRNTPPWAIELNEDNVPDSGLIVSEFGKQVYTYMPVFTAGNVRSNYYVSQCEDSLKVDAETKKPVEFVSPGLLSNRYVVAIMEKFMGHLGNKISISNTVTYHYPFLVMCMSKSDIRDFKVFDDDTEKFIFSLITGTKEPTLDKLGTSLGVVAINSYNGTKSLCLNFSLNFTAKIGDKEIEFKDLFTLSKESFKVNHIGGLNDVSRKIDDIENRIKENADKMKQYKEKDIDDIAQSIASRFSKGNKGKFMTYWEQLSVDSKNLYNVFLLASVCLFESFTPQEYVAVENRISSVIKSCKI